MSALGQTEKSVGSPPTSVVPLKADIQRAVRQVRFVPEPDSRSAAICALVRAALDGTLKPRRRQQLTAWCWGASAAGLTFNLEPLFTSAAHTGELFEEPVRID